MGFGLSSLDCLCETLGWRFRFRRLDNNAVQAALHFDATATSARRRGARLCVACLFFLCSSQPLNINLTLLLSANYEKNYAGGLKMLSLVMRYLQAHPLFTRQNAPALPVPLERLAVEWHDLNLESLNNLWSVMGGSYRPSVVYKLRMLVIEDDWLGDDLPVITGADVSV
ncbi:MAG: DUF4255 domain-containing protein [Gammaproteobacteria bacterium]